MKKNEFFDENVQELNSSEVKQINGGWLGPAIAIAGALIYLYNEGGDFVGGFKDGWNS